MSGLRIIIREERSDPSPAMATEHWLGTDVVLVLVAASTWGFAFSTFYLLPTFLVQELGVGAAEIGFVVGILGVSTVAFTVLAAEWIDRLPRRHAMAFGALAMAVAAIGFTRVHALGVAVEVLRILQGISYALVVTSVGTLIAELVPHERLSQALGLSGASMLVMNAVAPAVAEPLAATVGWKPVFLLAAFAAVVSAALALRIRERPATATARQIGDHLAGDARHRGDGRRAAHRAGGGRRDGAGRRIIDRSSRDRASRRVPRRAVAAATALASRNGLLVVLRGRLARQYAIILTLSGAAFGTVFAFQQPYALALGRERVGGFFVAYAAAAILVRVGFGHVPDRFGRHRVALAALVLYAAVVLAMAAMRPGLLEVYGAIFGLAHGVFYPAINALAVIATPAHERGRIIAIFTGSFSLGLWAGPTGLGVVAAHLGYPAAFVVAAAGVVAAAIILDRSRELRAAGALSSPALPAQQADV